MHELKKTTSISLECEKSWLKSDKDYGQYSAKNVIEFQSNFQNPEITIKIWLETKYFEHTGLSLKVTT